MFLWAALGCIISSSAFPNALSYIPAGYRLTWGGNDQIMAFVALRPLLYCKSVLVLFRLWWYDSLTFIQRCKLNVADIEDCMVQIRARIDIHLARAQSVFIWVAQLVGLSRVLANDTARVERHRHNCMVILPWCCQDDAGNDALRL